VGCSGAAGLTLAQREPPSAAAAIVVGNVMNGWLSWKDKEGKTWMERCAMSLTAGARKAPTLGHPNRDTNVQSLGLMARC
jgi:hypothetical protein